MLMIFLYVAVTIAVIDWIAVGLDWRKVEYFTKPGVMLALLAWIGVNGGFRPPMLWFALGILFSLAGDVFLMLPREQFIAGLVSFLAGHIFFLIAFNASGLPLNFVMAPLAGFVLLAGISIYLRIAAGLTRRGKNALKLPVFVYSSIISMMLLSALSTLIRPEWQLSAAALASAGAFLFFLSDTLLAWRKFVSTRPSSRVYSRIAYHLGQIGIITGAALHYLFR